MNKIRKLLVGISPVFISFGIEIVLSIIIILFIVFAIIVRGAGLGAQLDYLALGEVIIHITSNPNFLLLIMLFMNMILGVILYAWYLSMKPASLVTSLKKLFKISNLIMLLFLGIGSQFFISGILSLIEPYFIETFQKYEDLMKVILDGNPLLIIINVVIVAPIVEEVIFRGIMLHKTKEIMPFVGANILQAAIFGIYHRNIIQGIYAFVLGILLGYAVYKFNSLGAGIVLHTIVNASSFLVSLISDSGKGVNSHFGTYLGLVGIGALLIIIGMVQLIRYKKTTKQMD